MHHVFTRLSRSALLLLLLIAPAASAQQYIISRYAGGAPLPAPIPDWNVSLTADAAGNQYFTSQNSVFRRDLNGVVIRIAGNSHPGYSGDGGPATSAQLSSPWSATVDTGGNVFIVDRGNNRIRKVSPDGIISTVAGDGNLGLSGDGGPATSAALWPLAVAVDGAGNLFIATGDTGLSYSCCMGIRKVSPDGIITTVAGAAQPYPNNYGDGGLATSALLSTPTRVAVDRVGNLYIAQPLDGVIRKVSPEGIINTVAGTRKGAPERFGETCTVGSSGNDGPATSAQLCMPFAVAVDNAGNLYVAEFGYRCCADVEDPWILGDFAIRKISSNGIISTVAGSNTPGLPVLVDFANASVALDSAGDVFFSDSIVSRMISPDGTVRAVLDNGASRFAGDGGPASEAQLFFPRGAAADAAGDLFIADTDNNRIRKVSSDGIITTVAGAGNWTGTCAYSGDNGPATGAQLCHPSAIAADGAGNLFIADSDNNRVRKVSSDGIITTVAGGDGGPGADLFRPDAVAVDEAGNIFFAAFDDYNYRRIWKVAADGTIRTIAGGGKSSPGDGGPATDVRLGSGGGLAVDRSGDLFLGDNARIRKVSPDGIITTVAGDGTRGYSGDGGPAIAAQVGYISSIALDTAGNMFINGVRKISPDGIITTIAGNGTYGYSGDGGPALSAAVSASGAAADNKGNLYVVEPDNNDVRILRPTNQSVLIGGFVDAASERLKDAIAPGEIAVIYGAGLGPPALLQNQPANAQISKELGGTQVFFDDIAAPILYTSIRQIAVVVPYAVGGPTTHVKVVYQGQASPAFILPVAPSAPNIFTLNEAGAGQAVAFNSGNASLNTAANPVKIGDAVSLYATGAGQTAPASVDGRLGDLAPTRPVLRVSATVGGITAPVQYAGSIQDQVAGLMRVDVQIPSGVRPGGYVPVILTVGERSSGPAVWIAVTDH